MSTDSVVKQFVDLLYAPGECCDFGCDESELQKMSTLAQEKYPAKGICAVKDWAWWDFDISQEGKDLFTQHGILPSIIYAQCVLWDKRERWPVGSFVRTTPLVSFEENCFFVTRNSVYLLVGKGSRKTVNPMLANSVG